MLVCRVCRLDCAAGAAPDAAAAALARVGRDEAPLIDRKGEKPIWDEYQIDLSCWWPGECPGVTFPRLAPGEGVDQ